MNLSIQSVSKQYRRDFWGLRGFSLEWTSGVFGLLGPNGAGTSALMRIIATITDKTEGMLCWNGVGIFKHLDELRPVLGYLPQDFGVYPNLNARVPRVHGGDQGIGREVRQAADGRRIPPRIEVDNIVCCGQVQAHPASLQADEEKWKGWIVLAARSLAVAHVVAEGK